MSVPKYDDLFNPLLSAMRDLGGSATVSEQEGKVADILNLSDKEVNEIHRGNTTKLSYRLAWSRNYLKRYGLLENSSRGVWSLTQKGKGISKVDKDEVNRTVSVRNSNIESDNSLPKNEISIRNEPNEWQEELLDEIKKITPGDFEKLCQRLLREAGFVQVIVTGRTGDGGIDGRGIIKIGGFLSFRVIFQCKRYKGAVSSKDIREFKGTMAGRADKGLFLTTGIFTRDAKFEASRDGAPPVDLVDGREFAQKMKELGLGVKINTKEIIEIDTKWFGNF